MAPARGERSGTGDAPSSPETGGSDLGSSREVDVEIVVPCYNEAARLRVADFVAFARDPETRARLLFVNDGSTDGTLEVLRKARRKCPERIDVRLSFLKPWRATNDVAFEIAPSDGGTVVTWRMSGEQRGLMAVIGKVVSMDRLVGKDFEKGLARLAAVAEA